MQTWVSHCGRYCVQIEQAFIDEAIKMAREHYPKEVGSSLVGSYSDDGWAATVLRSAPLPEDSKAGRSWFQRGIAGLKNYFNNVFAKTAGMNHYVGEWHSHPDGAPDASDEDDKNMMAIVEDAAAKCPESILLILGYSRQRACCRVYVYSTENGRIDLNLVSVSD